MSNNRLQCSASLYEGKTVCGTVSVYTEMKCCYRLLSKCNVDICEIVAAR